MSRMLRTLGCAAVLLGMGTFLGAGIPASETLLAQKSAAKKKGTTAKGEPATAANDSGPKFSTEIAPILARNCADCHNPDRRRGKFDLSTFEKLMAGSDKEKVIVPGKPDESHLVLRLRGEETPKMPQGNNRTLSDEAIATIERWIKAGARLDAGIDPRALLATYAPTPEQLRVAALKKLSPEERDKKVEAVALRRWRQASPKKAPEVTATAHFLLFSTLPKERAAAVTKGMETAYTQLRAILSQKGEPALDWVEKTSLFVFNDAVSFVEFARSQENRDLDSEEKATANFATNAPYVAAVDPLGGREGPSPTAARKSSRSRRAEDEKDTERSVTGLLAEQLAIGVLKAEGSPPAWLCQGVGAYFAVALDPRSSDAQKLRGAAFAQHLQGWTSRANDALGGQLRADDTRAIGHAIVDWMAHDPRTRPRFPAFVRGMIDQGQTKLDDVLQEVFGIRRQDLLSNSEQWVFTRYGRGR